MSEVAGEGKLAILHCELSLPFTIESFVVATKEKRVSVVFIQTIVVGPF